MRGGETSPDSVPAAAAAPPGARRLKLLTIRDRLIEESGGGTRPAHSSEGVRRWRCFFHSTRREDHDMNNRTRAVVTAALIVLLPTAIHAAEKYVAFDETFDVKSGAALKLEVSDMDVEVKPGPSDQAQVVVTLTGDLDKARERFENSNFDARVEGGELIVETRERHGWHFSWSTGGRVGMLVTVTVPERFDVSVKTSDGDVVAGGVEGEIDLKTSDGDVDLGELKGPSIYVKTSDGDVTAEELVGGDVEIRTSDGDLRAELLRGDTVVMSTSDGEVVAEKIEAKSASVRSSDGNLRLGVSGGKLKAKTSDGDLEVRVDGRTAVDLSTSDGDIIIRAPSDFAADLDLKGEYVKLGGKIALEGEVSKRRISGKLGGGGPLVRARTTDGSVTLRFD
jgi:DUF4097 and DUF4098 domain-containing protein YvlB